MDTAKCMAIVQDLWLWPFFKGDYRVLYRSGQMSILAIGYLMSIFFTHFILMFLCVLFCFFI